MDTRERLIFDLVFALRQKTKLDPRGRKRQHADDPAFSIAAENIIKHLELCGWKFENEVTEDLGHSTTGHMPRRE